MRKLEKEFEKAISYTLTDEDIEKAKLLIGVIPPPGHRTPHHGNRRWDPELGTGRR